MTEFAIKKSDLSIAGYFRRPAFALPGPKANLHGTVVARLSDFCSIGADYIRISQDANPLSNASVTYDSHEGLLGEISHTDRSKTGRSARN